MACSGLLLPPFKLKKKKILYVCAEQRVKEKRSRVVEMFPLKTFNGMWGFVCFRHSEYVTFNPFPCGLCI